MKMIFLITAKRCVLIRYFKKVYEQKSIVEQATENSAVAS